LAPTFARNFSLGTGGEAGEPDLVRGGVQFAQLNLTPKRC